MWFLHKQKYTCTHNVQLRLLVLLVVGRLVRPAVENHGQSTRTMFAEVRAQAVVVHAANGDGVDAKTQSF